jgi:CRISPR-associated protein Cas2
MMVVVSYDVTEDRARSRVAQELQKHGQRVQESVFECIVPEDGLAALCQALVDALGEHETGNIRVYRLCEACFRRSVGIGEIRHGVAGSRCIVI